MDTKLLIQRVAALVVLMSALLANRTCLSQKVQPECKCELHYMVEAAPMCQTPCSDDQYCCYNVTVWTDCDTWCGFWIRLTDSKGNAIQPDCDLCRIAPPGWDIKVDDDGNYGGCYTGDQSGMIGPAPIPPKTFTFCVYGKKIPADHIVNWQACARTCVYGPEGQVTCDDGPMVCCAHGQFSYECIPASVPLEEPRTLYLSEPVPSPAQNEDVTFACRVMRSGKTHIAVFDNSGKTVWTSGLESVAPGDTKFSIPCHNWTPGVYTCVVEVNQQRFAKRFTIEGH